MEFSVQNGLYHILDHVVRFLMEVWKLVIGDTVTRCYPNPHVEACQTPTICFCLCYHFCHPSFADSPGAGGADDPAHVNTEIT